MEKLVEKVNIAMHVLLKTLAASTLAASTPITPVLTNTQNCCRVWPKTLVSAT